MDTFSSTLRARLAQSQGMAGEHPSADILSAFVERSLDQRGRERVLAHLASCPSCREAAVLAAPDSPEFAMAIAPRRPGPQLLPVWSRWAAAMGALAVALGIGVVSHEHSANAPRQVAMNQPPKAPAEVPPSTAPESAKAEPSTSRPEASHNFESATLQHRAASRQHRAQSDSPVIMARQSTAPSTSLSASDVTAESESQSELKTTANTPPAAAPPVSVQANAAPVLDMTTRQAVQKMAKPLNAAALPGANGAAREQSEPLVHWTVLPGGKLQRTSQNGNANAIAPARNFEVRAVAAGDIEVWAGGALAGNVGALYHSIDAGDSWTRVDGPWRGPVNGLSLEPQGVKVMAQDGTWITRDGGKTWQPQ